MTKEEFLKLSEKLLAGECTPDEEELLRTYNDPIHLANETWDELLGDRQAIYDDLRYRLNTEVKKDMQPKKGVYFWLKIAAMLLVFFSAGAILWPKLSGSPDQNAGTPKVAAIRIHPGGNNAYLTLSNGSKIALNNKGNGKLTTEQGTSINKTQDGLLVYNAGSATDQPGNDIYNMITTPMGGQYQVILADGTKVWLNANSSLKFPVSFNRKERMIEVSGEAYFEVAKDKMHPFVVKTDHAEVLVLGTHFNVSAYPDDLNTTTTLLEGSVNLHSGTASALLKPGQQGTIIIDKTGIEINNTDLEAAVAWKNGLFVFRDENVISVMKKVARWYNVEVEYRGNVKNKAFGGTVSRFKNITEFLDIMKLAGGIRYKIEGRRVIVMD
jgi:transmembrane sensor